MRGQNYGAVLAMGGYLLFLARSHLWRIIRVAFSRAHAQQDALYRPYRWIVWALIACFVTCVAWLCTAGMSLPVAVAQVVIMYMVYLVLSRLVAETGMFFVCQRWWSEHVFPLLLPGIISAKDQALAIKTILPCFNNRETLMPFAFNALRLGHEAAQQDAPADQPPPHVKQSFIATLLAAIVVSLVVAGAASIALYYSRGVVRANTWTATYSFTVRYNCMLNYHKGVPNLPGQHPAHMAVGAAIIVLLGTCRLRFPRWPLVPIAFCMATSDALGYMWFSIFIGWACKGAVMRVGGVSAYNRLRPLFLGMVIGEVIMAGGWMVVGAICRLNGYEEVSFRILAG